MLARARIAQHDVALWTDAGAPADELLVDTDRAIAVLESAGDHRGLAEAYQVRFHALDRGTSATTPSTRSRARSATHAWPDRSCSKDGRSPGCASSCRSAGSLCGSRWPTQPRSSGWPRTRPCAPPDSAPWASCARWRGSSTTHAGSCARPSRSSSSSGCGSRTSPTPSRWPRSRSSPVISPPPRSSCAGVTSGSSRSTTTTRSRTSRGASRLCCRARAATTRRSDSPASPRRRRRTGSG